MRESKTNYQQVSYVTGKLIGHLIPIILAIYLMFYEDALGILVTLLIAVTKYPRNDWRVGGFVLACGLRGWNLSSWERDRGQSVRILKLRSSQET